jgi:hypothetical protein
MLTLLCCTMLAATVKPPVFFARRDYSEVGGFAAVADVNGDGIPDIVVMTASGIYTYLGKGNGQFRPGPSSNPGGQLAIYQVVPIDLNGDGKSDLIVGQNGGFEVCFGNGDGTFQAGIFYGPGGGGRLAVGDFNGDGLLDVVTPGSDGLYFYAGKGGGVFNTGVLTPVNPSGATNGATVTVADFNGDGKLDVATAYRPFPGREGFAVAFGNGDGTFQVPTVYLGIYYATWLASGDLNGDGYPDIVASSSYPGTSTEIFFNNGQGQFLSRTLVDLPGPQAAIGDVNGDGILDLVSSQGYVALGLGNAKFGRAHQYPVESSLAYYTVVLADLRKNGRLDIVTSQNGGLSVLLNDQDKAFIDGVFTSVPGSGNCAAEGDFNKDGKPDLAVPTINGIVVLLGTGMSSKPYTAGQTLWLSGPGCPISGDVNGDGIPDILEGANSLGGVGVFLGQGDGTFLMASVIPFSSAGNVVIGDFNHDGKVDVATSANQLAHGNGDGTFQSPVPIVANPPTGFSWIASGDVDNDGFTDLVASSTGAYAYLLLNNKQGGFTLSEIDNADFAPTAVALADLNKDGNLDLVVTTGVSTADVLLGNGQGMFTSRQKNISYPSFDSLPPQIGDVNGDGIPDLLLPGDGTIGIALGAGNGTFYTPFSIGAGPGLGQVLLQNLHGQSANAGLSDLVAPDSSGGVFTFANLTE